MSVEERSIEDKIVDMFFDYHYYPDITLIREIIEIFKQSGYLHPDDVVEGWHVLYTEACGYDGLQHYQEASPATLRDILDGKAVKG